MIALMPGTRVYLACRPVRHPDERGRGVGRQMVDAAEEWLRQRGIAKAQLLVLDTNATVVTFYERLGFTVSPRIILSKMLAPLGAVRQDSITSQARNIAVAKRLVEGVGTGAEPSSLAAMFARDVSFEVQGDDGVLPWIGCRKGRPAAEAFFRDIAALTKPVKFEVQDILGSAERAVIIGYLETMIKSSGKITKSQFAIVLTISAGCIGRFQMLEDSFDVSRAVRG